MTDQDWLSVFLGVLALKCGGRIQVSEEDILALPGDTRLRIRVVEDGLVAELVMAEGGPVTQVPAGVVVH